MVAAAFSLQFLSASRTVYLHTHTYRSHSVQLSTEQSRNHQNSMFSAKLLTLALTLFITVAPVVNGDAATVEVSRPFRSAPYLITGHNLSIYTFLIVHYPHSHSRSRFSFSLILISNLDRPRHPQDRPNSLRRCRQCILKHRWHSHPSSRVCILPHSSPLSLLVPLLTRIGFANGI